MEQALSTRPRCFPSFMVQAWTSGPGAERRGAGAEGGGGGWGNGRRGSCRKDSGCHSDIGSVILPYQNCGSWFVHFYHGQKTFHCGSWFVDFYHRQKTLSNVVHGLLTFPPLRKLFPMWFMVCQLLLVSENSFQCGSWFVHFYSCQKTLLS